MNLALRDIRHSLGRFVLTAAGIGMLLMVVMGMGGIYRGMVEEATLLVDRSGADLWVVQRGTRGPFAEVSRLPRAVEDRVRAVPGVKDARSLPCRTRFSGNIAAGRWMMIQGLSWPSDRGQWLPIVSGRALHQAHYEMIASVSTGLSVGDRVPARQRRVRRGRPHAVDDVAVR